MSLLNDIIHYIPYSLVRETLWQRKRIRLRKDKYEMIHHHMNKIQQMIENNDQGIDIKHQSQSATMRKLLVFKFRSKDGGVKAVEVRIHGMAILRCPIFNFTLNTNAEHCSWNKNIWCPYSNCNEDSFLKANL